MDRATQEYDFVTLDGQTHQFERGRVINDDIILWDAYDFVVFRGCTKDGYFRGKTNNKEPNFDDLRRRTLHQ